MFSASIHLSKTPTFSIKFRYLSSLPLWLLIAKNSLLKIKEKTLQETLTAIEIIENKSIPNMILYGPPGTGKTTLANIVANTTGKKYVKLNGVIYKPEN